MSETQSLRNIAITLAKLDQRVDNILENQQSYNKSLGIMMDEVGKISGRVAVLESKIDRSVVLEGKVEALTLHVKELEMKQSSSDGWWRKIGSFVVQAAAIVIGAMVLSKLGIDAKW
jgi:hypothetical protein